MCARERGISLFETVLVFALLALAGLILLRVLIPSFRTTRATQQRVTLRQEALVAGRWLALDLQQASPAGIAIRPTPAVLTVQPIRELTVEGKRVWEQFLVTYTLVGTQLKRGRWDSGGSPALSVTLFNSRPGRPTPTDLLTLAGAAPADARTIANNVSSLSFSHGGLANSVAGPITVELELRDPAPSGPSYRMRKSLSPRMGE